MQNLITQLLQPDANMSGPNALQRRAAAALQMMVQNSQNDKEARVKAERAADIYLNELCQQHIKYGTNIKHEEAYREAMNEDYRLNCT